MGAEAHPHTAHTYNDVPFVYLDPAGTDGDRSVRDGGSLCDVAPTVLALAGLDQQAARTGEHLLA
jgi:2,3-bisphosphoglycerate-independent phosphoglycerate mutase